MTGTDLNGAGFSKRLNELTMDEFSSYKLRIKINNREVSIDISDICYCQADRCYSRIFLKSGKSYLISKSLKRLEKQLPKENFHRCHRSYLVTHLKSNQ
ncbi:MAG: LytR/AlgR family response regulator transcription factor [Mangrovibacterium sp.]